MRSSVHWTGWPAHASEWSQDGIKNRQVSRVTNTWQCVQATTAGRTASGVTEPLVIAVQAPGDGEQWPQLQLWVEDAGNEPRIGRCISGDANSPGVLP